MVRTERPPRMVQLNNPSQAAVFLDANPAVWRYVMAAEWGYMIFPKVLDVIRGELGLSLALADLDLVHEVMKARSKQLAQAYEFVS